MKLQAVLLGLLLPLFPCALAAQGLTHVRTFTTSGTVPIPNQPSVSVGLFDGVGSWGLDVTGNGVEELIFFSKNRMGVIDASNKLLWLSVGPGAVRYKTWPPFIVRVGPHQYVALKSGAGSTPSPQSWHYRYLDLHWISASGTLNDTAYTMGQRIAAVPFSTGYEGAVGDPVVLPGESGTLVATAVNNTRLLKLTLTVGVDGAISLTPGPQRVASSAQPNLGDGLTRARVFNGVSWENYLFCTQIIREKDMTIAGSWVDTNGHASLSGHQFDYTVLSHVDSTLVVNRGSYKIPDFWVYILTQNGRLVGGRLTGAGSGGLSIGPRWITASLGGSGVGAESLAFGRMQGEAGRVIYSGQSAVTLDGAVLASAPSSLSLKNPRLWAPVWGSDWKTRPTAAAYVRDRYFSHVLHSGIQTFPASGRLYSHPVSGVAPGSPQFSIWSHGNSTWGGTPREAGIFISYDQQGLFRERICVANNTRQITVWAASNETAYPDAAPNWQIRDANLAHFQSASHNRAVDGTVRDRALRAPRIGVTPASGQVTGPATLVYTLSDPAGLENLAALRITVKSGAAEVELFPALYNQYRSLHGIELLKASTSPDGRIQLTVQIDLWTAVRAVEEPLVVTAWLTNAQATVSRLTSFYKR